MNYKNQLIIFSKNRASQLKVLLDSLKLNAPLLFDRINVLYKTTSEEYELGYKKLTTSYPYINYLKENNFRRDLFQIIDDDIEATTFMVDDDVLYKPIFTRKVDLIKPVVDDLLIFSLRLGENCVYSHPANLHYKLGEHIVDNEFLIFDYTKQMVGDFNYPLSVDGHVYNTRLIKDLLIDINFINPNTLEANLQRFVISKTIPKTIKCFRDSKLVGIPANLVNDSFKNRHGVLFGISEKELNDKFLNNETIDLNSMDFSGINGPHKEIKYKFKIN